MKKRKIDLGELAFAMESGFYGINYYLDLETGAVVPVTDESRMESEDIYEESYNPEQSEDFDLVGSLTTGQPDPKDADLLVTVTDETDLAPLATLGCKLNRHAQSFGRGGDVFLADPGGTIWAEHAPGSAVGRVFGPVVAPGTAAGGPLCAMICSWSG